MPRFRSLLRSSPVLIAALFLACQGDDMPDPDGMGGQGGEGGAPSSEITRTLGQNGGELETSNTTLFVPSGALEKNTELTVSDLSADEIELLPQTAGEVKLIGFPSKFTPHGLTFDQPADVELSYPPPDDAETPVVAMKLENDQDMTWEIIPGASFEAGTASFKIDGFSIYACFEDPDGLAEMLYGPGGEGTGGAGSGGAGTGGEGTGGEGTGGDGTGGEGTGGEGTGGATGGAGGTGGSGGGGPSPNGYLDTPTFKGYGYTEPGTGATIESDLASSPGPNCANGSTGPTSAGQASLVYYVNQGTDNIEGPPILVPDAGLRLEVTDTVYQQYVVELRGEPGVWCHTVYTEGSDIHFIPWESFNSIDCPGNPGEDAFDPTTDTIVKVALTVTSNGEYSEDFDYCIEDLSTGLPNGYMNGPSWYGGGWIDYDGLSSFDDDLSEELFPNCVTGATDASPSAFVGLAYNLDQSAGYGSPYPVTVQGTGLELDLLMTISGRDLQVRLVNSYDGVAYCASIPNSDTGTVTIPWDDFLECDSGAQFVPVSAPVDAISVRVLSSSIASDPFDLCIERLEEDIPID